MRELFSCERKLIKDKDYNLFSLLNELGSYYITGSSAIVFRGLSYELQPSTASIFIVGERKIAKFRGLLRNIFSKYNLLIVEQSIEPKDYVEVEVYFENRFEKANLAILEKAIADALWKIDWERNNVIYPIYCLLQQPLDLSLIKKHAKSYGAKVEGKLRWFLQTINNISASRLYSVEGLAKEVRIKDSVAKEVEEAIRRVLGR